MAALINLCDVVIANDSGPMHITNALDVPILSLHGPTDPKLQGPFGKNSDYIIDESLECIICNKLICPKNHECFYNLDENVILEKIKKLLAENEKN